MVVIYYSLIPEADGTCERQWARSVQSLRTYNRNVAVVLCLYGSARRETFAAANRADIGVQPMGEFIDAFGDVPRHWRDALSILPTLHKLLSLRKLVETNSLTRLVYLDCDTFFFGDVADLAARYTGCDWYAREEFRDARALGDITSKEGLILVPPYNTGVVLLTAELAHTLVSLLDDFVWYAWRLLLGICPWRPELIHNPSFTELVRKRSSAGERRLALAHPFDSFWLLDEVAASLTLGRFPGLTRGLLDRKDVTQGDEYKTRSSTTIMAHYFHSREARFFARIDGR
jgi:hypothetical protein